MAGELWTMWQRAHLVVVDAYPEWGPLPSHAVLSPVLVGAWHRAQLAPWTGLAGAASVQVGYACAAEGSAINRSAAVSASKAALYRV